MVKVENIINDILMMQIELKELDLTSMQNIFLMQALRNMTNTVEQLEHIAKSQSNVEKLG